MEECRKPDVFEKTRMRGCWLCAAAGTKTEATRNANRTMSRVMALEGDG
jgi:hypothetical protein